jgi:hypothetical protein
MRRYRIRSYRDSGRAFYDSYGRLHIDRRVYLVRHNDGIKDLFGKLKQKVSEAVSYLKQNRSTIVRRIVKLLLGAVAAAGAIFAAKSVIDGKNSVKRLEKYKENIEREASQLSFADMQDEYDMESFAQAQGNVESDRKAAAATAMRRNELQQKYVKTKMLIKGIVGVLGVIASAAGAILMKSKSENVVIE